MEQTGKTQKSKIGIFPVLPPFICHHWKTSNFQLLLIFSVDLPHEWIHNPLSVDILLYSVLIAPLFVIWNPCILLHLLVGVSLFPWMLLQYINRHLVNKTQTIKYRKIHTFFIITILFSNIIPLNIQQITFTFFREVVNTVFYPLGNLLFGQYQQKWIITHLSLLPIFKFNFNILLLVELPQSGRSSYQYSAWSGSLSANLKLNVTSSIHDSVFVWIFKVIYAPNIWRVFNLPVVDK